MSSFRFVIPQYKFDGTTYPDQAITVIPDKGFTRSTNPRILTAKFGDGYSQRVADGINPLDERFSIVCRTRPADEIDNIIAYFEVLGGVESFDLIISDDREISGSPVEKTISVLAVTWNTVWDYDGYYSCNANLERTYTPV